MNSFYNTALFDKNVSLFNLYAIHVGLDNAASAMHAVVGLNMPKVQSKLMQERTLAFNDAVKIAIAVSLAVASCANIDAMRCGGSAEDGTV